MASCASSGFNKSHQQLEGTPNHVRIEAVTWIPPMSFTRQLCPLTAIILIGLSSLNSVPGMADESALISVGPRIGFTGKSPFLGKEQKYNFHLTDLAATWRLPWSWSLGSDSSWKVETRLITSAGHLAAASEHGFMGTVVPCLALSGWNGLLSIDAGAGAGFFSRDKYGVQDFGGPVQIVATVGAVISPIPHGYAGFRAQHFSDAGLYGPSSLGVDLYIIEAGYKF
jgi:hypothetical protein